MSTVKTNQIQTTGGKVILPSTGSILQVAYADSTTQVTTATQYNYAIIHSVTLTSVSANSRYFIAGSAHGYSSTSTHRANLGFSVTISGTTTRITGVDGASGDTWGNAAYPGCQYNRSAVYTSTAAAGTSMTFNLLGGSFDTTTGVIFNYTGYNHKSVLTVMEVSA